MEHGVLLEYQLPQTSKRLDCTVTGRDERGCDGAVIDQVVVLPDGSDAKGWYVSLSRARYTMHVYTRDKAALRQSVMHPGEPKKVWELVQALRRSKLRSRDRMIPDLWAARQAEIVRDMGIER